MYFGDESRHLRTDVDVSFTLDGGRVGIFHLRIFGRQGDGGNLGSRHLLLLLTAAARTHGDEGCACYNCGGSIHYGNFHTSFFLYITLVMIILVIGRIYRIHYTLLFQVAKLQNL